MLFTIFPAIDLRHGQVVRLRQGDPAAQTVYDEDPAAVAQRWAGEGAAWLHVVNLDGAFGEQADAPVNLRRLAEIHAAVPNVPVQFGGGVRSVADVARALDLGARRVVLGTAAVREPRVVEAALREFGPEQVAVGIDARDGQVAVQGWLQTSEVTALQLAREMRSRGLRWVVYTDISRDGMLTGVNVEATRDLARQTGLRVIASGGVAGLADVDALAAYAGEGVAGMIVGQALYTGALDLAAALVRAGQAANTRA